MISLCRRFISIIKQTLVFPSNPKCHLSIFATFIFVFGAIVKFRAVISVVGS